MSIFTTIVLATLGSGTLSILVTRWFDRRQTDANVEQTSADTEKTKAETADILTQASTRALNTMAEQLATAYQHIAQLRTQQEAILGSLDNAFLRIRFLENRLSQYETVHPFTQADATPKPPTEEGEPNAH